jgi:nucleotide-binding universal stress UspA family protein
MKTNGDRSAPGNGPVLLCFDGSGQAANAIADAGVLLAGGPALVLNAWEPIAEGLGRYPGIHWPSSLISMAPEVDAAAAEQARELAERGVELARSAGFEAKPMVSRADHGVWAAIAEFAKEQDVRAIVLGAHGLSTARPFRTGSVARALLEHCQRPMIVGGRNEAAEPGG